MRATLRSPAKGINIVFMIFESADRSKRLSRYKKKAYKIRMRKN
jgi:hypothetical protein